MAQQAEETAAKKNPVRDAYMDADEEAKNGDPTRAVAKALILHCLVMEAGLEKIAVGAGWRPAQPGTQE